MVARRQACLFPVPEADRITGRPVPRELEVVDRGPRLGGVHIEEIDRVVAGGGWLPAAVIQLTVR